jgi:ElaB/YqjD/DUF883 family membrane-anchored ribosome-binding protein
VDTRPDLDVMREQIDQTRSSLTEKLETLEADVKETVENAREAVEGAREAVQETISSVTETVHDATETVKRNLNLEYQVNRHPWAMLGLSLVSGVALGVFLGGRMKADRRVAQRLSAAPVEPPERAERASAPARSPLTPEKPNRPGFMNKLTSQFSAEFEEAEDLVITTLVGVFHNVAKKSIPALGSAIKDMMTHAASQFSVPPQQHGTERPEPTGSPT